MFMNRKNKVIALLSMIVVLALTLCGCAQSSLDGSETIATMDETNIPLGEFNLMLRYQQAQMETYYGGLFGGESNIYQQDMSGTGVIYGETAKETLIEEFKKLYILEAEAPNYQVALTEDEKAAIKEAATKFLSTNTDKAKKAVTADQATVEHVLTLMTLENKMYTALTADVDTEVSDEEAAQKRISYLFESTSGTEYDEAGNVIELTDEEKAEKKAALQEILDAAKESGDLSAAAEAKERTASSITYGEGSTAIAEEVQTAANALADGEFAELIETSTGYYAVQMVSTFDQEATDNQKGTIVQRRKDDIYTEKYQKLQEAHTFTPVETVLSKLTFERIFTLKTQE